VKTNSPEAIGSLLRTTRASSRDVERDFGVGADYVRKAALELGAGVWAAIGQQEVYLSKDPKRLDPVVSRARALEAASRLRLETTPRVEEDS
jgi:hypothetical protein